jgi:hypothetical protein
MTRAPFFLFVAALCACAPTRFADRMVLWHYPDDRPVARPPERRNPTIRWEGARDAVFRPAEHFLGLEYARQASGVNALDEVPDSSWFVDRRRDPSAPDDQPRWLELAPEVAERGAAVEPEPSPPFTVLHAKTEGSAKGLVVLDAEGVKYLLKLDPPGHPGLVTSTEVVVTRLAWAAGWMVPSERLIDLPVSDLQLSKDAWTKDKWDHQLPFGADDLAAMLSPVSHDGTLRALASRLIEGDLLGWFTYYGRDKYDANDLIDHQNRRDLRGFGTFCAWVDNVDTFENNTLDSYVGAPGQGHVLHYQQDVGASFGTFAGKPAPYYMGLVSDFPVGEMLTSFFTLGLVPAHWASVSLKRARDVALVEWPEFGMFDAEHFYPRQWAPVLPTAPFVRQTKRDRYWGAKQVARFTEAEVRAAIRAGRYRPVAAEHLFEVLWRRREKIARAFFSDVAPLDHFRLEDDRVCFEDLWITAGLGGGEATLYRARERSPFGVGAPATFGRAGAPSRPGGCARLAYADGYRVLELSAKRPWQHHFGPTVRVHLSEHNHVRHVIGVER